MHRQEFLQRIRQAAHAGLAHRVTPREIPPGTGYVGAGPDICQRLAEEILLVGGTACLVADLSAARAKLHEFLRPFSGERAICWQHPVLDQLGLSELLSELQITPLSHDGLRQLPEPERRQMMLGARLGISSVSFAIAETGTMAVFSGPGQERLASLLPPLHLAVIRRGQIVADLLDLFTALGERAFEELPSNVALITGPSKTGDIELQLTTGVHGPGSWVGIICRE